VTIYNIRLERHRKIINKIINKIMGFNNYTPKRKLKFNETQEVKLENLRLDIRNEVIAFANRLGVQCYHDLMTYEHDLMTYEHVLLPELTTIFNTIQNEIGIHNNLIGRYDIKNVRQEECIELIDYIDKQIYEYNVQLYEKTYEERKIC
jgi:hypothetical protein